MVSEVKGLHYIRAAGRLIVHSGHGGDNRFAWLPWSPQPGQPRRLLLEADDHQQQIHMQLP